MKRGSKLALPLILLAGVAFGQASPSRQMADAVIRRNPAPRWVYEEGTMLDGLTAEWKSSSDEKYFDYVKQTVDALITEDGTIKGFKSDAHSLDNLEMGRAALMLYRETKDKKYETVARFVRAQLDEQPRTPSGGFWHKAIYPNQMWLDGAFMAEPFYAMYAATFDDKATWDDIAKQFLLMDEHLRDLKTGLMYHGWDESRKERWSDSKTGRSKEFWARAMGWYVVALVDVLEYFPKDHPKQAALVKDLNDCVAALEKVQDRKTGVWWDVLDKGSSDGNYVEASASSMFVYGMAKGARMGWVPKRYQASAVRGWAGIQREFVKTLPDGTISLTGIVAVSGLGGKPYRDGTYDYYIHERTVADDLKGIGAFLMAGSEMERIR
ncbi:MAG: glycoside hydrolase family 88 protein [Acidobacteria bacterium]|nr:glycoside hydrolase family 88 protein [Acidobacteriota bacterium]